MFSAGSGSGLGRVGGFKVWGLGSRVWGIGSGILGFQVRSQSLGFRFASGFSSLSLRLDGLKLA